MRRLAPLTIKEKSKNGPETSASKNDGIRLDERAYNMGMKWKFVAGKGSNNMTR